MKLKIEFAVLYAVSIAGLIMAVWHVRTALPFR